MAQAIVISSPGSTDVMQWKDVQLPAAAAGEVVIDIRASGVNNADILQRQGMYPVPADDSSILGLECSGIIGAVGHGVTEWSVGDKVCALLNGGGYATEVAVPAAQVLPKPEKLTFEQAASLPEAACTVFSNIGMLARLQPGETLLMHGGTSGIGTLAIQWAKALGAHVITTAGTPAKVIRAKEIGADVSINYRQQDFPSAVMEATGGKGANVIFDIVGAPYLDRNINCLAPDGRIVMIGGDVSPATLSISALMMKRGSISATTLRARDHIQKAKIVSAVHKEIWPMVEKGLIQPVIDSLVPMAQAARAHQMLESGAAVGKVVLTV
ncbi:NAD(P)H-quinone oxidoreductase [Streptomyces sp. NPDC048409]|uniref:NAD(P)H-quinone oxidoreductase n=1 Tax=Streptomyces sp. NPDC048409 TaxID=3154723 RepID=UPI00343E3F79